MYRRGVINVSSRTYTAHPLRCVQPRRHVSVRHEAYHDNLTRIMQLKIEHAHSRAAERNSIVSGVAGFLGQGALHAGELAFGANTIWPPAYLFTGILLTCGALGAILHGNDRRRITEELKTRDEIRALQEKNMTNDDPTAKIAT